MSQDGSLALPPDSLLLHIGPHKTGTTAVQSALRNAKPLLPQYGAQYVGSGLNAHLGALYVTGSPGQRDDPTPRAVNWQRLRKQVKRTHGHRGIVSSERFCTADPEAAKRIVAELGGDRVHIVITLRPLARMLASQWQQHVQIGLRVSYQRWLRYVFAEQPTNRPAQVFWRRHAHDELTERWAAAAGVDHVTVVVADDDDRAMLTGAFETLLALPNGTLVAELSQSNRSLTYGETEIIRRLNQEYVAREWSAKTYRQFISGGVAGPMKLRQPSPDEPRVVTPRWAAERAAERAGLAAKRIAGSGVRVIGDLDQLTRLPSLLSDEPEARGAADAPSAPVPASAAVAGIVGVILATEAAPRPADVATLTPAEQEQVAAGITTRRLAAILRRRLRDRARRALRR